MEKSERFARTILNGIEVVFAEFQNITLAAKTRFENADWHGLRESALRRIDLRKVKTAEIISYVELIAGDDLKNFEFWREVRSDYARLVKGHNNFEIAETYYNSVFCALFKHRKIRNDYAFVFSPLGDMPPSDVSKVYKTFRPVGGLRAMFTELLDAYAMDIPYENLELSLIHI